MLRIAAALGGILVLAACGGGGGGSGSGSDNGANGDGNGITPKSALIGDILFSTRGLPNQRVAMDCAPDLSSCTAT